MNCTYKMIYIILIAAILTMLYLLWRNRGLKNKKCEFFHNLDYTIYPRFDVFVNQLQEFALYFKKEIYNLQKKISMLNQNNGDVETIFSNFLEQKINRLNTIFSELGSDINTYLEKENVPMDKLDKLNNALYNLNSDVILFNKIMSPYTSSRLMEIYITNSTYPLLNGDTPTNPSVAPTSNVTPNYPNIAPSYPSIAPSYPSIAPNYPSIAPSYPSIAPSYPSIAPSYPSIAPSYPNVVPSSIAPSYPSIAPSYPNIAPNYPSIAPSYPNVVPSSVTPGYTPPNNNDSQVYVCKKTTEPHPTPIPIPPKYDCGKYYVNNGDFCVSNRNNDVKCYSLKYFGDSGWLYFYTDTDKCNNKPFCSDVNTVCGYGKDIGI